MTARLVRLLALAAFAAPPGSAQLRPTATATTRLVDPVVGSRSPSLWLGFGLEEDRPAGAFRLTLAGALAARGRWGGELAVSSRLAAPLGHRAELVTGFAGTIDRPIRGGFLSEGLIRGGIGRRVGPALVSAELGGLAGWQALGFGGLATTRFAVGTLELSGEVGQFVNMVGSFGSSLASGDTRADSGIRQGIRRLGHAQLGGRWRRDWLELSGRVLRRTKLSPADRTGWEIRVGVEPLPGTAIQLTAARAPIGPSIYLPFRRQLSLGIVLVPKRPRPPPNAAAGRSPTPATFEVVARGSGPATVRFRHPTATRIELIGDFSDWRPIPLARVTAGTWEMRLDLPPGLYLINLSVDGGPFEVPPGLDATDDGFGGRAGVLVIR